MTFSSQIVSDLSVFVGNTEFGTAATYTPSGGEASTINIIKDERFFEINELTSALESTKPVAMVRDSDVPNVAHGDALVTGSITYSVIGIQQDGTGLTLLILEEQ
tara:strand:+ start:7325 stop:7639 length:315 start_codon:yes stop_codon:yes gene_type:complete